MKDKKKERKSLEYNFRRAKLSTLCTLSVHVTLIDSARADFENVKGKRPKFHWLKSEKMWSLAACLQYVRVKCSCLWDEADNREWLGSICDWLFRLFMHLTLKVYNDPDWSHQESGLRHPPTRNAINVISVSKEWKVILSLNFTVR